MPLTFNTETQTFTCPVHGDIGNNVGWVPCWAGCDEGFVDEYDDDPINCIPGEFSTCEECHGKGGWKVCGGCNKDNPDVEW